MNDFESRFGKNLRKLRLNLKMTQIELGELLGYSVKAISKWERGSSVPSVSVLFDIAKFFKISIDELFREEKIYLLAIDGGGMKTHLALCEADGVLIREYITDSCNPIDIGLENSKAILKDAIFHILGEISTASTVMYAGISGGTSYDMKSEFKRFFGGFGFYDFENGNDAQNIISAGLGDDDGIAVIMGTGFCIFSQKGGRQKRYGGWGYFFDDGGSAFNIGREALAAHFRSVDGLGEACAVSEMIKSAHPDEGALLGELYRGGKKLISSFAPFVFEAAKKGDCISRDIIDRNMVFVSDALNKALCDFDKKVPIILAGGMTKSEAVPKYLKEKFGKAYDVTVLAQAPVFGALKLARGILENSERKTRK